MKRKITVAFINVLTYSSYCLHKLGQSFYLFPETNFNFSPFVNVIEKGEIEGKIERNH